MGWLQDSIDPKEEFPIDFLPLETLGEKHGDALSLFYRHALKERESGQRLPVPVSHDRPKEAFFRRILPILDGFDNIFKYAGTSNIQGDETLSNWLKTLETMYRRLLSTLEKEGLVAIESVGQKLDLSVHEVVQTREVPGVPENTIVEELVKGYRFGRRVLRDAKVIVAQKPSAD
ncbi:MAG TPA: nucleotide exchange factor GrpE, partial [bacterium]|nr:nucleotide exchange factor GrpE [bacterium]